MSQQENITRVKEQHKQALLDKPNVVGVGRGYKVSGGQTTGEQSVVILVRQKLPPGGAQPGGAGAAHPRRRADRCRAGG